MKILYVEDNVQEFRLAQQVLAHSAPHITLKSAASLQAARAHLQADDFDAVLLDLRLPDGSGIDLLTEIRARALPVAVVVLTGAAEEMSAVAALRTGANDYLSKEDHYLVELPRVMETAVARFQTQDANYITSLRVLYVEDSIGDVDLTRRHLRQYAPHIRLDVVHTMRDALRLLPQQPDAPCPHDVLLFDYNLPGLGGLEALKFLREKRQLQLPVVLVTGQGSEKIAVEALHFGVADYLIKHPHYLFELPKTLENAYRSAQLTREKQALSESERRYRVLADNTLDVIWQMDLALQFTYVNKAIEPTFGYTPAEFTGTSLFDHATAAEMARMAGIIQHEMENLAAHTDVIFESGLLHKAGHEIPVEIHGRIHCDENLNPLHLQGTVRDIRERKAAETALRESESRYRNLFENNHTVMLIIDPENGDIIDANPAAAAFYGWSRTQLKAMRITRINTLPPAETKTLVDAALHGKQNRFSFRHRLADNAIRDVEVYSGPIQIGGRDMLYSIIHDVTQQRQAEAALRQKTAELDGYFENALDLLAIADRNGRFHRLNRRWEEVLGFPLHELKGVPLLSLVHPDDIDATQQTMMLAGEEKVINFVNRYRCRDGSYRWLEWRSFPTDTFIYAVARDITESLAAEEQLRLQSAALEATVNAIVITNREGKIQWANPAFTTLTGYTFAEAVGKRPGDLVSSGLYDAHFYQNLWKTIRAGSVWQGEIVNRRKDGVLYTEDQSITPVRNAQGEITHYISIRQDITKRKAAEQEREKLLVQVQAQAERMQQILETVPAGVLLLDANQTAVLANPAARRMLVPLGAIRLGSPLEQLGDRPLTDLLHPRYKGRWQNFEIGNRLFTGVARPMHEQNVIRGWVLIITDITELREQQRYQEAQTRLATVGQLAAGIAHDFNNIISVITVYAQLMQKSPQLTEKEQKRIATIYEQAHHAANLISQILDFSRRSIMERQIVNLLPLLKETQNLLQRALPESIDIELVYDEKTYPVLIDPTRIQQVLMNLAINARDAMPQGGRLTIAVDRVDVAVDSIPPLPDMAPGQWVMLIISDTGTGIQSENLPHLFEPFFTTKAPGSGTGLGLAQVHGIIKQHDGSIDVRSQLGKGSSFVVYLPLQRAPQSLPDASQAPVETAVGKETILLVEDNESMRASLAEALTLLGYDILEATDGHHALSLLATQVSAVSLVLTDLIMPGMGGLELMEAIQQQYPALKLLMMTGYTDQQEALSNLPGTTRLLQKPFTINDLAESIRHILDSA